MSQGPVSNPTAPVAPVARTLPIQNYQVGKEDFTTDGGIARFNTLLSQIVTAIHAVQGVAGPSVLPSGVDVAGATVTGLGAPQNETDAVSLGHANGNYSAPVLQPKFDIGGSNALKGLTGLWMKFDSLPPIPSTGSGSNANGHWFKIGSLIVQFNANVSLGAGDFSVTYPIPFTTVGVPIPVAVYPSGNTGYLTVVAASGSTTGFTIHQNNLTGMSANWIAVGI